MMDKTRIRSEIGPPKLPHVLPYNLRSSDGLL